MGAPLLAPEAEPTAAESIVPDMHSMVLDTHSTAAISDHPLVLSSQSTNQGVTRVATIVLPSVDSNQSSCPTADTRQRPRAAAEGGRSEVQEGRLLQLLT